jgi:hypothetical protein
MKDGLFTIDADGVALERHGDTLWLTLMRAA